LPKRERWKEPIRNYLNTKQTKPAKRPAVISGIVMLWQKHQRCGGAIVHHLAGPGDVTAGQHLRLIFVIGTPLALQTATQVLAEKGRHMKAREKIM
jgi:hypothetical protein